MCILIGKSLTVFRNCCLSLHSFWVKNAKIPFFEEKGILSVVFIELKGRWLPTGLAHLKKTHQTSVFFLRVDFLRIFENITLFEIFENHLAHAKVIECILFYLNMAG